MLRLREVQQQQNNNSNSNSNSTSNSSSSNGNTTRGVRFGPDIDPTSSTTFDPNTGSNSDVVNVLAGIWDTIYGYITACIVLWCIGSVCIIFALLYITIRPLSKSTYRRLVSVWGSTAFIDTISLLLPNCRLYITGDSDIPSPIGSSVFVTNHIVPADWWAIYLLGRCIGLRGNIKGFLRNEYLQVNIDNVVTHGSNNSNNNIPNATTTSTAATTTSGSTTTANGSTTATSSSSSSIVTTTNGGSINALSAINLQQKQKQQQLNHQKITSSPTFHHHKNGNHTDSASSASTSTISNCRKASPDISIMAKLLHLFLEFPLMNGEDYTTEREQLFTLLRSFASPPETASPIHLLLYPECYSMYHGIDHETVHAKSNHFAKRENKPTLKHLLLPRTRGFNASLECLRDASPVVYDITMAYSGYDGSLPPVVDLSLNTLWDILRRKFPREIHLRLKRYSIEEVIQDSTWLYKTWAEKDRLLHHFSKYGQFPIDNRGYCRHRIFDTRTFAIETSILSFIRLLLVPCAVPIVLLLSVPLFWTLVTIWLFQYVYKVIYGGSIVEQRYPNGYNNIYDEDDDRGRHNNMMGGTGEQRTPGSASSTTGTPFFPATPFASPSILNWRDMFSSPSSHDNNNGSQRRTR